MHSGHLGIWESHHIGHFFPLWLHMASKQTVQILPHNRVIPWMLAETLMGWDFTLRSLFFSAKKRSRWRTTCHLQRWASGLETVLEVIQNVETAQCASLSLSTASHRHNTELTQCSSQPSMFVKFTLYWKNVHMNPKMTDIPECSIWSTTKSTSSDR